MTQKNTTATMRIFDYQWEGDREIPETLLGLLVGDILLSLPGIEPEEPRRNVLFHVLSNTPRMAEHHSETPSMVEFETVRFERGLIAIGECTATAWMKIA